MLVHTFQRFLGAKVMKQIFIAFLLYLGLAYGKIVFNETVPFDFPLYKQCDEEWGDDLMVTKVGLFEKFAHFFDHFSSFYVFN